MFGSLKTTEMSGEWDFPVHKDSLYVANPLELSFEPVEGRNVVRRSDTGQVLSIVSDRYQIIHNGDLVRMTEDALKDIGLDFKAEYSTYSGHSRFNSRYEIQNDEFQFAPGHFPIKTYVMGVNSYDKSTPYRLSPSFKRLVCENGMMGLRSLGGFSVVHYGHDGEVSFDIMAGITEAIQDIQDTVVWFNQLSETPIGQIDDMLNFLEEQETVKGKSKQVLVELLTNPNPDMGRDNKTMMDFYNCFTEMITHHSKAGFERKTKRLDTFQNNIIQFQKMAA